MAALKTISGISAAEIELLEAAGYLETSHLEPVNAGQLLTELEKANAMLKIVEKLPTKRRIEGWIDRANGRKPAGAKKTGGKNRKEPEEAPAEAAEEVVADQIASDEEAKPDWVDYEAVDEVLDMISRSPLAVPLPAEQLAEQGIAPSAILVAPVLNRAAGDLEIRVTARSRRAEVGRPRGLTQGAPLSKMIGEAEANKRRGIDTSRVRSMTEADEDDIEAPAPLPRGEVDERLKLLTTARESTNRGRSRDSRFFIRGVLHDRPWLVIFGSLVVLLITLDVPLAVIGSILLVLSEQMPDPMGWVPKWLLVFPALLAVLGVLYMTVSVRVKCRVCGQREYVPRHCRKHVKAHHVPGLGHILPLAAHVLLFKWFHCTFCGTAVRIKE
ncbi:DUF4332 domain-containing protein [Haloferula sargassicola]|uniref:DUF4332 domain-containing protein n=1 Tax=Haloferula sargassicola TaxID=490096 RepID=A0ABP9UPM0_9BACT